MMPEDRSCAKEEKTAYAAWMAETVEPYLKEHGEKGYLKMEDRLPALFSAGCGEMCCDFPRVLRIRGKI